MRLYKLGHASYEPHLLHGACSAPRRYTAASSRAVVLRQCIQLPTPLWRECLTLIGGKHAEEARG